MAAELVLVPSVLLDRLAAVGVDPARVLRHAGIPRERFRAPKTRLTVGEFFAFWRAIAAVGGSGEFGLRLGAEAHPHQFDVAALAALHAPTFGAALETLARYKRVVCGETLGVDVAGAEACVGFHWVHVEDALPLLLVDAAFASIVMLARRGTGRPVRPLRVELARRRADEDMLRRHFGCEVRFDAPRDVLVFDAAALALPFATHNADLLAMLLPGLETALGEGLAGRSAADDVRLAIGRRMRGERPSVEAVAAELHMSPRTLQRRLGALGTTYQHVLDEVRHDTSRRLLGSTDLDAAEVAFLLGFEEVNSFTARVLGVGKAHADALACGRTARDRGARVARDPTTPPCPRRRPRGRRPRTMNVLLFGATGMVGDGVLHECLRDPRVTRVLAVGRSPLGMTDAKLRELRRTDFFDYADLTGELRATDACFFCLGVSAAGMREADYRRQTFDLTLAAARALAEARPGATFCYVSGEGTDPSEQGRVMWARVKGATENALLELPLVTYLFRPGFIRPWPGARAKTRLYRALYAVAGPLYPVLTRVAPTHVTTAEHIGRAMIAVAGGGSATRVLENPDINAAAGATGRVVEATRPARRA